MRWLTYSYDFRFKWTATEAIGIHPTKSWLSQLVNFKNAICVYGDNKCTVWCKCGNCTHNYSRGTEDAEDLREVCTKGARRRAERKMLSWQQGDGLADQFRSRSSWCSCDLRWKLDLLLWLEFTVEACWLSQTQEGQTQQIHPQTFDYPFLIVLAWSTCAGFPRDRQSTKNTMLRF